MRLWILPSLFSEGQQMSCSEVSQLLLHNLTNSNSRGDGLEFLLHEQTTCRTDSKLHYAMRGCTLPLFLSIQNVPVTQSEILCMCKFLCSCILPAKTWLRAWEEGVPGSGPESDQLASWFNLRKTLDLLWIFFIREVKNNETKDSPSFVNYAPLISGQITWLLPPPMRRTKANILWGYLYSHRAPVAVFIIFCVFTHCCGRTENKFYCYRF